MKKMFILVFLWLVSTPLYAANKPIINIQTWDTDNGAHVYFVKASQIPMVDVQIVFAAGSAYDAKQWGIASFANSMLSEGTKEHSANQIAETLDDVGAELNGGVDRDKAVIGLRSLTKLQYLNPALKTFTEIVTQPSFPEKAFMRVKNQTIAAIQESYQQPGSVASQAFYRALYQDEPYGHSTLGTANTVNGLTREKLINFYKKYYVASNADIIIVGDVSKDEAKTIAQKVVGALPKGEPAKALLKAKQTKKHSYQFIPFPAKQNTIILGQVGITRENKHYLPLIIGNHILGGLSLSSKLFDQVRNQRGLAYSVHSQFAPLKYRGPFVVTLQTRADKSKEALRVVEKVLHNYVKNGPTQAELDTAKQNLLGSFPLRLATNSNIVANVSNIAFYGLPLNYLDTYRQRVSSVTAAQIKKAFQQEVHPNKMKVIIVGSQNNKK